MTTPRAVLSLSVVLLLAGHACTSTRPTSTAGPDEEHATQEGIASWYGPGFHGKPTASGEIYDMHALTAAHRTLALGTTVEVRNLENGRTTIARINDRGPHRRRRIIDLSLAAAEALGIDQVGLARVRLTVIASPLPARYWVQVGAFEVEENARALRNELEPRYPGTLIRTESGWFQVRVPSGEKRRAAEALRRDLRRAGFDTVLVRQPRSKT
ncbi:MAG TPA: septal ring lytic transglycosylase RlpA family protein [Thermoanaerobaculia bacterium]|jgi:rare lipoprotein A|nr:septal ring lytic transglycosylase RlpA family protein [Thermoanaerobaculia bacterium]